MVDIVLHVAKHIWIGAVEKSDTASGNFTIDSGQTAENDVIEHDEGILTSPVPRRIETTSLKNIETGLDAIDVGVAVFSCDAVELCLQCEAV